MTPWLRPLMHGNFIKSTYFATLAFMYGLGRCDYLLRDPSYQLLGNQSIVDMVVALSSPSQILIDNYKQENLTADNLQRWSNLLALDVDMVAELKAVADEHINEFLDGQTGSGDNVQLSHLLELFSVPHDGAYIYIDIALMIIQLCVLKLIAYRLLLRRTIH